MMQLSQKSFDKPERLSKAIKNIPEVDKVVFDNPTYRDEIVMSLKEAFKQNPSQVVTDFRLLSKPLGIDLESIKCPVIVWQGEQDMQAPVQHAQIYAEKIPHTIYHLLPNEAHISILYNHGKQILQSVL